ncbi:hypothetical protein ACSBM8_08900 [Sphingomonas sp. ASY06-1R]|uniref:hypothetical protein n=1 Tax=Sphingomonas sp. ASY06-1R TaxID=3445771 RepID=UPI003FA226E2
MKLNGGNDKIGGKFSANENQQKVGKRAGGLLARFGEIGGPVPWRGVTNPGGQLNRDITVGRPNLGGLPIQSAYLLAQPIREHVKPFQRASAAQRAEDYQNRNTQARAAPRDRRSFDIAGRFHDFQAGPKIARPNLAEEFIPVIGPAWDAVADLQEGNYGSAAFNAAMAVSDVTPIGFGIKAVRGASKITRALKTSLPKAYAVQRKIHKLGLASRLEDVHHVFELNGIARNVKHWKNNPIFLKVLPRQTHQRLHHRVGDMPQFGPARRLWYGTTDWMKAGAAGIAGDVADTIENFADRFQVGNKPIPPVQRR